MVSLSVARLRACLCYVCDRLCVQWSFLLSRAFSQSLATVAQIWAATAAASTQLIHDQVFATLFDVRHTEFLEAHDESFCRVAADLRPLGGGRFHLHARRQQRHPSSVLMRRFMLHRFMPPSRPQSSAAINPDRHLRFRRTPDPPRTSTRRRSTKSKEQRFLSSKGILIHTPRGCCFRPMEMQWRLQ